MGMAAAGGRVPAAAAALCVYIGAQVRREMFCIFLLQCWCRRGLQ
jgi:hypothetical protein